MLTMLTNVNLYMLFYYSVRKNAKKVNLVNIIYIYIYNMLIYNILYIIISVNQS